MIDTKLLIKKHEGLRRHAYLDSRKIWTIGVGFNLERAGANEALRKHGINPDLIWAAIEEAKKAGGGRKPGEHTVELLNDAQIDALLMDDIAEAMAAARRLCPDYDHWPEEAKAVLVDLIFNVGETRLSGWKKTLGSFRKRDWAGVAKNLGLTQPWRSQVKGRADDLIGVILSIKPISSAP